MAARAKTASFPLANSSSGNKQKCLEAIFKSLSERKSEIMAANERDCTIAQQQVTDGRMSSSLFKRLSLSGKFDALLQGVVDVQNLADPNGRVSLAQQLDNHLELYRVACPVGVLLIIFEARPEVVVQISCLALKSGNAVILKGGKEASNSNMALFRCIQEGISASGSGISPDCVQLIESRDDVSQLLKCAKYIDLVIPRGSNQLVRYVQENTVIPVLGHADGICSMYVESTSKVEMAVKLVVDSKTNYPAACNSLEVLLVERPAVETHLLAIVQGLVDKKVKLRLCPESYAHVAANRKDIDLFASPAKEDDFRTEYLDLEMAIKVVGSLKEAVHQINENGSHHTDCIVTGSKDNADAFMAGVDSAGVYWNASTRFADGFRYGFGAEIGVSTNKTHARGPVGLEGLMIYKYKLIGNGQTVAEYNDGTRQYNRKQLDKFSI